MGNSCQKSPSSVPERGGYNVHGYLEDLGEDGVVITVLEIGHYREPFQSSEGGMDLMHDFVGLRVRVGVREKFIKAEKSRGGIKISKVESLVTTGTEIKHGPVGVEDCGEIGMGDLLAILKEHSPDYCRFRDNCWWYADSTYRRLIRKFSAHPTNSPERRSELKGFLNHPAPTMPFYRILYTFLATLCGTGAEVALAIVASIGAAVLAASAVAVNLFPVAVNLFRPEQLAPLLVTLRSATVQTFLRHSATLVQGSLRTMPTMLATAPAVASIGQILSAAGSLPAVAVTGQILSAPALSPAVAVTGTLYWPLAVAIGVPFALFVGYEIYQFALEATPRGQQRQRTGPSMTLL